MPCIEFQIDLKVQERSSDCTLWCHMELSVNLCVPYSFLCDQEYYQVMQTGLVLEECWVISVSLIRSRVGSGFTIKNCTRVWEDIFWKGSYNQIQILKSGFKGLWNIIMLIFIDLTGSLKCRWKTMGRTNAT